METIKSTKGCVYFFRHIGLTPVKIGFTTKETPIYRFNNFSTFAPYGSELLGFIITETPKDLESVLHDRFSAKRLKGEWFDIASEDVDSVVSFYSNIEDIKEKNDFQIAWAKSKEVVSIPKEISFFDKFKERYSLYEIEDSKRVILNQKEIMSIFKIEREVLKKIIFKHNLKIKNYWNGVKNKKGYELFEKIP